MLRVALGSGVKVGVYRGVRWRSMLAQVVASAEEGFARAEHRIVGDSVGDALAAHRVLLVVNVREALVSRLVSKSFKEG
jgi:hypothetical protein